MNKLNNDVINNILDNYLSIFDIYLINKDKNKLFNQKINKYIYILQRFVKKIDIPITIRNRLNKDLSNIGLIDTYDIKRFWIRTYPDEYIISNIKLAFKKVGKYLSSGKLIELKKLVYEIDFSRKNNNYFINKYVNLLTVDELEYVGY